ncbi:MAG: hypothetical protein KME17_20625 [Cyanosarcina radialis HA8281-LM2]|jgi:WD40 repeat protein|nr:hypothetical protein [Cyanosarcina radialis HA8281-LM2]
MNYIGQIYICFGLLLLFVSACSYNKYDRSTASNNPAIEFYQQRAFKSQAGSVYNLVITPDGKTIISCGGDRQIKIWDLNTGTLQKTIETEDPTASQLFSINSLAIGRHRQFLVTGSGNSNTKIWNLTSAKLEQSITSSTSPVFALTLSLDDKILAIARQDGSIEIWRSLP